MSTAILTAGGIGDCLLAAQAYVLILQDWLHKDCPGLRPEIELYINSHREIIDFFDTCTYCIVRPCPPRAQCVADEESPLNLPYDFLDSLFANHKQVYSAWPDSLGFAPFSFPWYKYVRDYQAFLRTRVPLKADKKPRDIIDKNTKNIFINVTSVTAEKNWPMVKLQKLIELLNKTNYNVILARTSNWKGTPIPFFCQGKFHDVVDRPIQEVMSIMEQCDYVFAIDSAMAHIAYHLGMPRLILQRHFNAPFSIVRWQNDISKCLPLDVDPEIVYNRIVLNLREPLTTAIPAYLNIPHNTNTKQLLIKKYYA